MVLAGIVHFLCGGISLRDFLSPTGGAVPLIIKLYSSIRDVAVS